MSVSLRFLKGAICAFGLLAASLAANAQIVQRRELPPPSSAGRPSLAAPVESTATRSSGPTSAPGEGAPATSRDAASVVGTLQSMTGLDSSRRLGVGDRLSYRVVEDKDKPVSMIITDAGEVDVPYFGRVRAAGKSCLELAQLIKSKLEAELYYRATVIVALDAINARVTSPGRIYLSGAVRQPGAMDIPGDEKLTVSKAILRAGGFADFGNQRKVMLIRKTRDGKNTTTIVDVKAVFEGALDKDVAIEPGDTIRIPEKTFNVGF